MSNINELLEEQFLSGKIPDPKTLLGPHGENAEWRVTMVTGPIPNMGGKWFRHRKLFVLMGENVVGCNILFSNYKWGRFKVVGGLPREPVRGLLLDYNVPENGLTRGIRDFVRCTDKENELLGEFYYKGKRRAFFTLTRIIEVGG